MKYCDNTQLTLVPKGSMAMNGIYVTLLHTVAGFVAFAGIHHLLLSDRHERGYTNHLFTLLSFVISGMVIFRALAHGAENVDALINLRRFEVTFVCFACLSLIFFFAEYTGFKPKKLLMAMTIGWLALMITNLTLPYGIQFVDRPDQLSYQHLPWGESVVDLRVFNGSIWNKILWLAILITLVFGIYAAQKQYRYGDKDKGRVLLWAMLVFFILSMFNVVINMLQLEFVHTSDFAFIALIIMMDIELLKESKYEKRRMSKILDSLPAGICLKDLNGRYQLTNRAFREFFGVNPRYAHTLSDTQVFPVALSQRFALNDFMIYEQGKSIESHFTHSLKGRQHTFELQQFLVAGRNGNPAAIGALYIDITEAQQKDELLQKLRNKAWFHDRVTNTGAIAKSLAHELSQPLAAILNNAQAGVRFMKKDPVDLQEITGILHDIVRDEKRAGAVINGIRTMLQQKETAYTNIDLSAVVAEVIQLMHTELIHKNIHLKHELAANLVVRANPTQLQQVMLNLIINAGEAMEQQALSERSLLIQTARVDNTILMTIRDSGTGIPEDQLDKIFEGFYTTKAQGLGIGLEVCRGILESHCGKIWAQNNLDRGATFYVSLPPSEAELGDTEPS
jgi:PAS domain S-box-containing protein